MVRQGNDHDGVLLDLIVDGERGVPLEVDSLNVPVVTRLAKRGFANALDRLRHLAKETGSGERRNSAVSPCL